jgi:hypothetical protein
MRIRLPIPFAILVERAYVDLELGAQMNARLGRKALW